jgi:hypothetical protein
MLSASLTESGSFEFNVSGKLRENSPDSMDIPPNKNRGRDST